MLERFRKSQDDAEAQDEERAAREAQFDSFARDGQKAVVSEQLQAGAIDGVSAAVMRFALDLSGTACGGGAAHVARETTARLTAAAEDAAGSGGEAREARLDIGLGDKIEGMTNASAAKMLHGTQMLEEGSAEVMPGEGARLGGDLNLGTGIGPGSGTSSGLPDALNSALLTGEAPVLATVGLDAALRSGVSLGPVPLVPMTPRAQADLGVFTRA
jgi:hypothetical protein